MALTLDELKALYADKGGMEQRVTTTEQGDIIDYIPVQLGDGWTAYENQPQIIGYEGSGESATPIYGEVDPANKLGGFQRSEGDKNYFYDTSGKLFHVEKQATDWDYLGPIVMGAMTMGGGAGALGSYLFPSLGATAAAGAGGALVGGVNAAMTDQDILKGALMGGAGSAGALQLGDTGFTLGDATKALNFAQNPTLAGALNIASPYIDTNFNIGDTGYTANDVLKGLNTVQALGSGNNQQIFNAITGLAKGADGSGLNADELAQIAENREIKRLNRIEDAVLNQPASDDGSTAGIDELIQSMYPGADIAGMSEGDMAKFLEANLGEIQGSADLETLLRGEGKPTSDEGTVNVTADRPTGLGDFMLPTQDRSKGLDIGEQEEMIITDKREEPYVSGLRTKEILSDIPDQITPADITKLFPDANINDILQLVTATAPGTKVTPTTKVTPSTPKTTDQLLATLGLNTGAPAPSQDPYANIKSMEEVFGGDIGYKLRALGAPQNLASADIDALTRLLRG
jgi:hypothetical protein